MNINNVKISNYKLKLIEIRKKKNLILKISRTEFLLPWSTSKSYIWRLAAKYIYCFFRISKSELEKNQIPTLNKEKKNSKLYLFQSNADLDLIFSSLHVPLSVPKAHTLSYNHRKAKIWENLLTPNIEKSIKSISILFVHSCIPTIKRWRGLYSFPLPTSLSLRWPRFKSRCTQPEWAFFPDTWL